MKRFLCVLTISIIIVIIGLHYNGVAFLGFDKTKDFLMKNNHSKNEGEEKYIVEIISNGIEKDNSTQYLVKIENRKFYLYLKKTTKINNLEYGEYLKVTGRYEEPNSQRNYKGFDYSLYLKTKKIYGIIYADNASKCNELHDESLLVTYNKVICKIQKNIYDKLNKNLNNDQFSVGLRTIDWKYIIFK